MRVVMDAEGERCRRWPLGMQMSPEIGLWRNWVGLEGLDEA